MRKRLGIAAALTAAGLSAAVGVLYLTLVLDWFAPRSTAVGSYAMAVDYFTELSEIVAAIEVAQKKYGPKVETPFKTATGLQVLVDGKVVGTVFTPSHAREVYGMFRVRNGEQQARFPFLLVVDEESRGSRKTMDAWLWQPLQERFPGWFDIGERDWSLGGCRVLPAPVLGAAFVNATLRLGSSDVCAVRWLAPTPASMLVGAVAAEGGTWVRHVSRRVCRSLASSWVAKTIADGGKRPDFVACLLVFDPHNARVGVNATLKAHVYQVGEAGTLAFMR
jgi:hypothetical protein